MTNPLTRQFKGYPVWGWLALLLVVSITVLSLSSGRGGGRPPDEAIDFTTRP